MAIHHLAWLPVADAHEAGVEPDEELDLLDAVSAWTDDGMERCPDDPRPYLRAAIDLLALACADGAEEAGALAIAARRLLEAHDAD